MQTTMIKPCMTVLAALGIALGTAGTASADESGFLSSVRSLDHYALDCPGCSQDALSVGYKACAGFERGGTPAAVAAVTRAYNGPGQDNQEYWATLFASYAASELCPAYDGQIGPI